MVLGMPLSRWLIKNIHVCPIGLNCLIGIIKNQSNLSSKISMKPFAMNTKMSSLWKRPIINMQLSVASGSHRVLHLNIMFTNLVIGLASNIFMSNNGFMVHIRIYFRRSYTRIIFYLLCPSISSLIVSSLYLQRFNNIKWANMLTCNFVDTVHNIWLQQLRKCDTSLYTMTCNNYVQTFK